MALKVLLDSCMSDILVQPLSEAGHDVIWCGDWDEDPGDTEILETAYRENRVLFTLDKDFGELAIVRKLPHFGIVRLVNISLKKQAAICLQILIRYEADLNSRAIITVEQDRVRVRPGETTDE